MVIPDSENASEKNPPSIILFYIYKILELQ